MVCCRNVLRLVRMMANCRTTPRVCGVFYSVHPSDWSATCSGSGSLLLSSSATFDLRRPYTLTVHLMMTASQCRVCAHVLLSFHSIPELPACLLPAILNKVAYPVFDVASGELRDSFGQGLHSQTAWLPLSIPPDTIPSMGTMILART